MAESDRPLYTMTSGEVARIFSVATVTVASWVAQGKLSAKRTKSGRYRFNREEVERLVQEADEWPEV